MRKKPFVTTIAIDKDLWEKYKVYTALRGLPISKALAEAIVKQMQETPIPNSPVVFNFNFEQLLSAKQLAALAKLDRVMDSILKGKYLPKPSLLERFAEQCGLLDKKRAEKFLKCHELLRRYHEGR
ncbi:MAG: hypothetical protein DRP09_16885 [Candidatus Thorarchaeota archaeon]|nr:MAG: hypothetical protein DRP09_16885 [Candidatus Thorarchaeota archaeon]